MTKRFLFAAALLAALSLAGCDSMLEQMYPEFKQDGGGGGGSKGQIVVKVVLDSSILNYENSTFMNGAAPIAVGIVPFYQASDGYHPDDMAIQIQSKYKMDFQYDNDQGRFAATFTFPVNRYAQTKVLTWLDINNNGRPKSPDMPTSDLEEPGIIVTAMGSDTLDLSYYKPSDPSLYMSSAPLTASSIINWNQFSPGGGGGSYTNLAPGKPTIEVPFTTVPSGQYLTLSSVSEYDPNFNEGDYIVEHQWDISVGSAAQPYSAYTGYSNFLEYQFVNNGTVSITATVRLKIKDSKGMESPYSDPKTITIAPAGGMGTNYPPIAAIQQGTSMAVQPGQYVTLYSSSTDPENFPLQSYTWTLDSYMGYSAQYSYANFFDFQVPMTWTSGNVNVTLTVTDSGGLVSTPVTMTLTIGSGGTNTAPSVTIGGIPGGTPHSGDYISLYGTFNDPDAGDYAMSWEWQLYGGSGSYIQTQYNYSSGWSMYLPSVTMDTQVYVLLRAYDSKGASSTQESQSFWIYASTVNNLPIADIYTYNYSPLAMSETAYFYDYSYDPDASDYIATRRWFVDGVEMTDYYNYSYFPYIFPTAGPYTVGLLVGDSQGATGYEEMIINAQ